MIGTSLSDGSSSEIIGLLLAVVLVSVAAGFWIDRWAALVLAPAAPAIMAIGGDYGEITRETIALLIYGPAAIVAVASGVGARRIIRLGDRWAGPGRGLPRGAAGAASVLGAAGLALGWFALAWFVLRAGLDSYTTCSHSPCFGAPATLGSGGRSAGEITYGAAQAVVAAIGIAALATVVVRGVLLAGRTRLGGPLRVAAIALAVWVVAGIAVDVARSGPAEAARHEGAVAGDADSVEAKVAACRAGLPFPLFDLGRSYAGMRRSFVRCNVYDDFAVYEVGYSASSRSLLVSGSSPQPGDVSTGCTSTSTVRGVPATGFGASDLRLLTRDENITVNLSAANGAVPLAVTNALRAPGFPPGTALPPRANTC